MLLKNKRKRQIAITVGSSLLASLAVVNTAETAQAATTCSLSAGTPFLVLATGRTLAQANAYLNCTGVITSNVTAELWRDVTLLPDVRVAKVTDYTQNSTFDYRASASDCDASGQTKGYYTKALSSYNSSSKTSAKVDLTCY
jgi:hypothetical protein